MGPKWNALWPFPHLLKMLLGGESKKKRNWIFFLVSLMLFLSFFDSKNNIYKGIKLVKRSFQNWSQCLQNVKVLRHSEAAHCLHFWTYVLILRRVAQKHSKSPLEHRLMKLEPIWVSKAKLFWQEIATFSQQQWTKAVKCAVLINFFWCILAFKINHNIVPRMQKKTFYFFFFTVCTLLDLLPSKIGVVKIHLVIWKTSLIKAV